ncbi:MAG: hypothetical protein IKX14_06560, partial [Neisseriaceae bacterium]|nr:hypothetical protein [Neisseriaceae bacterium]
GGQECPPYNDTCGVGGGLANPPYGVSVINRCVWWARMPTLRFNLLPQSFPFFVSGCLNYCFETMRCNT